MRASDQGGDELPKCERLLKRITASVNGDTLSLLKLRGTGVPTDSDIFLCKRTFVALQVRVKHLEQPKGLAHEYTLEPENINPSSKGGVYELRCQRSKHYVQVKVQPSLGLEELLPPYSEEATAEALGLLLEQELWPFVGVYYILSSFVSDPNKRSVPLATGYADSTKHVDWLLEQSKMLDSLSAKCPIFSRTYGQPPTLCLMDHERPKTRGMLLKAFLEVKMLIIRAVTQIRFSGEALLSERQFAAFEELMMYVYQDCCAGGVDGQHSNLEESMASLRLLICGDTERSCAPPPSTPKDQNGHAEPPDEEESSRLKQLWRALDDTSRHLAAGSRSLFEAAALAVGRLDGEASTLVDLAQRLTEQLKTVEGQMHDRGHSKRSRSQ